MKEWRDALGASLQSVWVSRPERERRMMRAAGIVLLPILFYALIWAPLSSRVDRLARVVPRERAALVRMHAEAGLVR